MSSGLHVQLVLGLIPRSTLFGGGGGGVAVDEKEAVLCSGGLGDGPGCLAKVPSGGHRVPHRDKYSR